MEQFTIHKPKKVSISYDASAQQGDITLFVINSNQKTVWAKNINHAEKGYIEFEFNAEAGNYVINTNTLEAKKIDIKLSLK